jgi:hypothetical protein
VTLAPALTFSWLAMRHAAGSAVGAPAGAPLSPAA